MASHRFTQVMTLSYNIGDQVKVTLTFDAREAYIAVYFADAASQTETYVPF